MIHEGDARRRAIPVLSEPTRYDSFFEPTSPALITNP
jgi:hypothetical protein